MVIHPLLLLTILDDFFCVCVFFLRKFMSISKYLADNLIKAFKIALLEMISFKVCVEICLYKWV